MSQKTGFSGFIPLSEFGKGIFNSSITSEDPLQDKNDVLFRKNIGMPTTFATQKANSANSETLFNEEMLQMELAFMKDKEIDAKHDDFQPEPVDDGFFVRPVLVRDTDLSQKSKPKSQKRPIIEEEGPEVISFCHRTVFRVDEEENKRATKTYFPPGFKLHSRKRPPRIPEEEDKELEKFYHFIDSFKFVSPREKIDVSRKRGKKIEIL